MFAHNVNCVCRRTHFHSWRVHSIPESQFGFVRKVLPQRSSEGATTKHPSRERRVCLLAPDNDSSVFNLGRLCAITSPFEFFRFSSLPFLECVNIDGNSISHPSPSVGFPVAINARLPKNCVCQGKHRLVTVCQQPSTIHPLGYCNINRCFP